ncbi:MAG: hypothetical protein WCG93_03655, partial [Paludibacter sp.]
VGMISLLESNYEVNFKSVFFIRYIGEIRVLFLFVCQENGDFVLVLKSHLLIFVSSKKNK